MFLSHIQLVNYNNYSEESASFSPQVNAFTGKNGMGKTNLLDAVYYLCIGKSYFSSGDKYVALKGAPFFRLSGKFKDDKRVEKVEVKTEPGKKKEIFLSGKKRERLSDHIGKFPCVIIAPIDIQLMLEGSEERRKLLDNTIMQYDRSYVEAILIYNRLLKQRNAMLKMFAEKHYFDAQLLESITQGMFKPAQRIHDMRSEFISEISPVFDELYSIISGNQEQASINYTSPLNDDTLQVLLEQNIEKDKILTRTSTGIHKDDLVFKINGVKVKNFASQGQLKSTVLALKLAQYKVLSKKQETMPILLLDDIFDKLDRGRVEQLLTLVTGNDFGQVFITDTSVKRVPELLTEIGVDHKSFTITEGTIEKY